MKYWGSLLLVEKCVLLFTHFSLPVKVTRFLFYSMAYLIHPPALLALEDGRIFRGHSFGAMGTHTGEICFNTSMSGYQEVLTDPSYRGQMVAMTYPLIGNYGVNNVDNESESLHIRGFIVEEVSDVSSNWRAEIRLQEYLRKNNIVAIAGIDTRSLTRHLRISGVMRACITTELMSDKEAVTLAKNASFLEDTDLVAEVSTKEIYEWDPEGSEKAPWGVHSPVLKKKKEPLVVAYDFGVKKNILRLLRSHGMRVMVVPAKTSAEEVLSLNPDGIFFSNGPGDPAKLASIHENARQLSDHRIWSDKCWLPPQWAYPQSVDFIAPAMYILKKNESTKLVPSS